MYLEKAFQANKATDDGAAKEWIQKADLRIQEISNYIGTTENPIVQKFQGMLALAKGEQDKAVRLMYSAYEQSKALDKEGQRSGIDPVLCITLADIMKERGEPGMQREFLEKAIINNNPIILQKPDLILDYAEILRKVARSGRPCWRWSIIIRAVMGSNLRSQILKTQRPDCRMNQFDQAQQALSEIPAAEPVIAAIKNRLVDQPDQSDSAFRRHSRIPKNRNLSAEQTQKLTSLRQNEAGCYSNCWI